MGESIMDKLQKVLALAERGIEGEKVAAETLLNRLLDKYDMTIEDLKLEQKESHRVWWDTKAERQMIVQIFGMLFGHKRTFSSEDLLVSTDNNVGAIVILSHIEWIEFEMHYNHYRKVYRDELKDMRETILHATCQKYRLFITEDRTPEEIEEDEMKRRLAELAKLAKMTPEQREEYEELLRKQKAAEYKRAMKARSVADGMDHKGLYKQIGKEE